MTRLVVDIEANGLLDDSTVIWCIVTRDYDTHEVKLYHDYPGMGERDGDVDAGIRALVSANRLFFHGGISYDVPLVKKLYGVDLLSNTIDTLVLSRLFYPDREGGHSVEAWGEKLGHPKVEHEDWSCFSLDMLERCIVDVEIQDMILRKLAIESSDHDWGQSIKSEHQIADIMFKQEQAGWWFDSELAEKHIVWLDKKIKDINSKILGLMMPKVLKVVEFKILTAKGVECSRYKKYMENPNAVLVKRKKETCKFEICEPPNPNSRTQLIEAIKPFGWKPVNKTDKGRPKLDLDSLEAMEEDFPGKQDLIEKFVYASRRAQIKNPTKEGLGWLNKVRDDHRIPAGANPDATNTHRMAHFTVVNPPKANEKVIFGKEMRELFSSPEGRLLVGCDACGLENRMLAHYMDDPVFTHDALHKDPHEENMKRMGVLDRNAAKTLYYAVLYGAGDRKVAMQLHIQMQEAKELRRRFFEALPNLQQLLEVVKERSKRGYLIGLDGRKVWMRKGKEGKILEHTALNTLLQSAGSIAFKRATIIADNMIRCSYRDKETRPFQVGHFHDEYTYECDEKDAKDVAKILEDAIIMTAEHFKLRCPLAGEAKIGSSWDQIH